MTEGVASTYEEMAERVTAYAGPEAVEKIMAGYEDVTFRPRSRPYASDVICERCGAVVNDQQRHLGWHRFITLGIRAMALDMLAQALAEDEAEPA